MTKNKKVFNFPIKTFEPDNLLEEMLNAEDGQIFILGEKEIPHYEGQSSVEITMVRIQKVRSE